MDLFLGVAGAVHGFMAVALGAFAAHGLKTRLAPDMLAVFETGARYQMYHALAILLVLALKPQLASAWADRAGIGFAAGAVIFSGSLYFLALSSVKGVGAITPFGGILLLFGWTALVVGFIKR